VVGGVGWGVKLVFIYVNKQFCFVSFFSNNRSMMPHWFRCRKEKKRKYRFIF